MTEVFEHNPGDHDDPLPGPTWIVGFLGVVLLLVIMLGLTALYYNAVYQEDMKKIVLRDPQELEHLRQQQLAILTSPPRLVEEKVTVPNQTPPVEQIIHALAIPIDQAMQLTVKEYSEKQVQR
jgi:hypothetical protein